MQISEILSIHDSFTADIGNRDILGDPFLILHNPVYRNIKQRALSIGCKYFEASPKYLLMPFHALGEIVESKTIPYIPSAKLLRGVESVRAGALSIDDLSIPESYHLHEAAHVIADTLFSKFKFSNSQENILRAIMCESFANSADAFACGASSGDVHRFFLKLNCYMQPDGKYAVLLTKMSKSLGAKFTFMCVLISYMHANFLKESVSTKVFKELAARYAPDVKFGEKQLKDCVAVFKMCDKLDPLFRVQTTQMYLKLEGHRGEIYDLLDFPFMKVFDENPAFRSVAEAMSEVIAPQA